jgi:hypothetical protein
MCMIGTVFIIVLFCVKTITDIITAFCGRRSSHSTGQGFLEQLIVNHMVKKFLEGSSFVPLSWASWAKSMSAPSLLKIHFNVIVSSTPKYQSLFSLVFTIKIQQKFLLSMHAICPTKIVLADVIAWTVFGEMYKLWSSSLCSFLQPPLALPHFRLISVPCFLPERDQSSYL